MNFFLYLFIHFHHGWQVEISLFSIIFTILQSDTPPHSVAEKTSISVKILPIGFSTKTRKSVITRRKWFFQNFRKKCTYGDFDENFSKFARRLGVKMNFFNYGPRHGFDLKSAFYKQFLLMRAWEGPRNKISSVF